jgi:N-acetylmuramoyl-L-alanine amidase
VKKNGLWRLAMAAVFVMSAVLGGCDQVQVDAGAAGPIGSPTVRPQGTISAAQMGARLGLGLQKSSAHSATLGNQVNTVMFFADPGGVAYVNGVKISPQGGIMRVGRVIYVPQSMEQQIRASLRAIPRPPVRGASPVRVVHATPTSSEPVLKYGPVIVDPGHGGKDPGAGHNGCTEKTIVLEVARMVTEMLRASGVDARMTRSDDTFVELNDRAAKARQVRAKLFISIHCDAAANRGARGFTIYTPETRRRQSSAFAAAIEKAMLGTNMSSRGVRGADFRVLMRTTCPAVLLELGYLTNRYDARRLASRSYQIASARAIANAVTAHLTK